VRWGAAEPERIRKHASELVALAPDVILANGSVAVGPLLQATRTVPIIFVYVPDPVGAGYVGSLARPGGNATGFTPFEYGTASKWVELLKEISTRAAVMRDPMIATGLSQFAAIQAVAPSLSVEVTPIGVSNAEDIERQVTAFAQLSNGGIIVTGSALATVHRDLIIAIAGQKKLPAVYFERFFVTAGGLVSFGANFIDEYRQAAGYVHRVLKGEKPADLPVQAPTHYELVINLKTAKALGLALPATLLARADEVIE
jgi:putative ABC transport system substrate-binding protein